MEPEVQPLTVDTATPDQPTLNIDVGVAPQQPPSEAVAQTRAYKAHMGMGDIVKQTYDEIYRNISEGQEDNLRKEAALEINSKAAEDKQAAIVNLAATKGSAITLADIQKLDTTPADPNNVIEKTYARAYVNTVKDAAGRIEDNILTDAQMTNPDAVDAYMNAGSDILGKREYALTKQQNAQPAVDAGKFWSYKLPDTLVNDPQEHSFSSHDLKQLFSLGFYDEFKLRGLGNTGRFTGAGLGENLDNATTELLKLPDGDFQKQFDKIYGDLMNSEPELAQKFARYVAGVSTSDKMVDNVMTAVNLSIFYGAGKGIAAGLKGVGEQQVAAYGRRGGRQAVDQGGLTMGPDGVYRATATTPTSSTEVTVAGPNAAAQAAKAVKDVVQSANAPEVTKASIAEGAGDVAEAAVQKAITSTITRPDPAKDAIDTLLSLHRADTDANRSNPGNLSREDHTRLLDAAAGFDKNTVDILVESSKVVRTPVLAEEGFHSILDKVRNYFPGRENTIADVTVRAMDVGQLTFHYDIKITNYDGLPFSSYELAKNHAVINGYPIEGIEGKAGEKVYLSPTAAKSIETVKTTPAGTKFYVDKGIETVPHANPEPGFIPYNLSTNKFEKALSDQTARIEQQGLGFHIIVTKPVNETEPFVRDGLISNYKAMSSSNIDTGRVRSIGNAIAGYIRNPYDTLSVMENENRAKTVFGQVKYLNLIKEEIKDVEDIYKGMIGDRGFLVEKPLSYVRMPTGANRTIADQFTRALVASQTMPDPRTGLPGYYMRTPAEIQFFWQSNFQRPASLKEQAAYLAVGRIDHFDHILRNASQYMFKSRLGVERWTLMPSKDGVIVPSPTFEASQVKKVNASRDEVTLIVDADGSEKYFHTMGTTAQAEFRKSVEEGRYLGVELYDPERRPLKRPSSGHNGGPPLDDFRIRYVFSNAFKRQPLSYDQVGYRGGGHWEYDYEHAVKQPIIRTQRIGSSVQHIYEGDTTFGFVANRQMGKDFAKNMNEVARLVRARQYADAKAFAKSVFDIEWKDLYKGFRPSKNPQTGEITPPRFSTDPRQEFRVVPNGRSIRDLDKKLEEKFNKTNPKTDVKTNTFVDGTRHGSMARNFQTAYTQPRDSYALSEFVNQGSVDKPFYNFRPAKLTDPIAVMTRALNRIVSSTYMDSMKISAAEHWLQENKDLIDATEGEIRSSPFYYFNEGKLKNNPDTILQRLNAESNRYKIKQLIGTPSKIDVAVQGAKQALSDARYESPNRITKGVLIAPEWMLDHIHNPIDFLRGMTYHLNLGLFSLKQVTVQSMAYTTIYGLAGPVKATQGAFGAMMYQWSRISRNPLIIDEMDKRATLFGWKLGEYKEAVRFMDRSGFGHIGNEISLDNGLNKQSFFTSDAKGVMRAGQFFFNEGNLHVRFGAYFTAFKEFRDANPYKKIGQVEEGQILYRANYLNTLMTRDANTVLNKGLVGVPFQFYDYMKKMADVFWSPNLGHDFHPVELVKDKNGVYRPAKPTNTVVKRAYVRLRMYMMYAMLGGAVGALGVTGIPTDSVRKHAIAGDLPFQTEMYTPGSNVWSTLVMEGPTSTLINYLTGNFYNFNNRFNPNGLQVLRDVFQTDPTFWKILLGAMGTTVGNVLASFSGFTNAAYSMMEGDPTKEAWPLKLDDWLKPLDNINAWSDVKRLRYALAFGQWLDKHGQPQSDVGKVDAIFRTVTGLTDQRIDDEYLMNLTMKDRKADYDSAGNEFLAQARLADEAIRNGDPQQADDYMKRAYFALTSNHVPVEAWGKYIARQADMNRDKIDVTRERYYLRFVPQNMQQQSLDAFERLNK